MKNLLKILGISILLLSSLNLIGCSARREPLNISKNIQPDLVIPSDSPMVYIESVKDSREFIKYSTDFSVPTMDEKAENDPKQSAYLIGRNSGSFGRILGNFETHDHMPVTTYIEGLVHNSFNELGYRIIKFDSSIDVLRVSIDIKKFWASKSYDSDNISVKSSILVTIKRGDLIKQIELNEESKYSNPVMFTRTAWEEIFARNSKIVRKSLTEYLKEELPYF